MKKYPEPRFFITRPGSSTITPLIAVDELPDNVHITGVPALMSHADTHGMTSLGVEERSLECYDVHFIGTASSSDYENPSASSETSPSDGLSKRSLTAVHAQLAGRQDVDTCTNREIEPQEVKIAGGGAREEPEVDHDKSQDNGSVDVEKWRRETAAQDMTQVKSLNLVQRRKCLQTQARIDDLIASHEPMKGEARGKTDDENPRAARLQAGLTPGKKVYCSHWIRHGECDFIQQGCLYKHEMPDKGTLKAIGIRNIPPWYLVAHPERAQEHGLSKGIDNTGRVCSTHSSRFPPADFSNNLIKPGAQASFRPFGASRFLGASRSSFIRPSNQTLQGGPRLTFPSVFETHPAFPRVQELSEQQYQQWQLRNQSRPADFQIMRKPYKSPGYKTFPFQLPPSPPAPAPFPEKPQVNAVPLWDPRQSKLLTDGKKSADKNSDSRPLRDTISPEIPNLHSSAPNEKPPQSEANLGRSGGLSWSKSVLHSTARRLSPNNQSTTVDAAHVPLKPSPPLDAPINAPAAHQIGRGSSLQSFTKAPETPVPVHRRLFVGTAEQRRVNEPRDTEPFGKTTTLKSGNELVAPKRDMKRKSSDKDGHISSIPNLDKPKKSSSRDDKRHAVPAEYKQSAKQIERKTSQASTQLLDIGK
ncbi:MAG: hypothetical protein Q9220_002066 [cf. Caloplaca sp. 1 TL-2023]